MYEKLPDFCYFCGLIGHSVTECGDGVHEEEKCQWGEWIKVVFEPNNPPGGGRGSAGRSGLFGRRRGRGRVPGEPSDSEATNMDWGTVGSLGGGQGTRKRPVAGNNAAGAVAGTVAQQVNLLEYGKGNTNAVINQTSPQKVQPIKRQKKVVDGVEVDEIIESATSGMEDRREQ
jgi:hypothetical protein